MNLDTDHVLSFAVWPANAEITLVNVNWNNDYRDVWRPKDQAALDKWIDSKPNTTIKNMQPMPAFRPVRLNVPFNKASRFNYIRVRNAQSMVGDIGKTYYYFITDVAYLAPNTTQLTVQLDVWQTYIYDAKMGNCYIEKGHIGIANSKAFQNYGRDYLSIPEGMDVGAEYQIARVARQKIMDPTINGGYSVLVTATVDLTADPGTADDPKLRTASGGSVDGIPSGASFYVLPTGDDFRGMMRFFASRPWVSQGIVSLRIIPDVKRYAPEGTTLKDVSPDNTFKMYEYPSMLSQPVYTKLAQAWRDDTSLNRIIPERYRRLKKFFTYPYMVIELTTWTGSPLIIRPESWADADAQIREQAVMLPPGQRIAFMPFRYNASASTSDLANRSNDDGGDYLDFAVTMSDFPSLPIVNNQSIAYLAQNKNALAFAFQSADWSQTRALQAAATGYDQATSGIGLNSQLTGISTSTAQQQADLNSVLAISQVASGAIQGGGSGGPAGAGIGAGVGAISAGADIARQQIGTGISNEAARRSTGARNDNAGYLRDTNRALAEFSARGDYENTIAGTNAKIQDARLMQPSTSGQFGGDAMNLAHFNSEVVARWKVIDPGAMASIGEHWLRYGYAVNRRGRIPDDFRVMEKFTYWKLAETYLTTAPMPESHKQAIRGIFEKGVTVWSNPDDIGVIDIADNAPLAGITY